MRDCAVQQPKAYQVPDVPCDHKCRRCPEALPGLFSLLASLNVYLLSLSQHASSYLHLRSLDCIRLAPSPPLQPHGVRPEDTTAHLYPKALMGYRQRLKLRMLQDIVAAMNPASLCSEDPSLSLL